MLSPPRHANRISAVARRQDTPAPASTNFTTPPSPVEIAAALHAPTWPRALPVELEQISPELARVRLGNEASPRLAIGSPTTLRLIHGAAIEVRLGAILVQLHERPVARLLVLRWTGGQNPFTEPGIARLFERRLAARVAPTQDEPLRTTLTILNRLDPARSICEAGLALDVSTGGLAMEVSRRFDRAATTVTRVTCGLILPGSRTRHVLQADIRHRHWQPDATIQYSLRFDLGSSGSDRRAYSAIHSYVQLRQAATQPPPRPH